MRRVHAVVLAWTSGALVAIYSSYALISNPRPDVVRAAGFVVLCVAVFLGIFNAWRVEYHERVELEQAPQLRLHFVPGTAPYEQDHAGKEGDVYHYIRVGVTHDGLGQIDDVRVLLASLEPAPDDLPLYHALPPMGEKVSSSACAIAPGNEPTRFFDVLFEERHTFTMGGTDYPEPTDVLFGRGAVIVCLAAGHRRIAAPGNARIRLVAEGRNAKRTELSLELAVTQPGLTHEPRPIAVR